MTNRIRPLLGLVLMALVGSVGIEAAGGELNVRLPQEAHLNQFGLTLGWWGQAVLDPRKDRVEHLTADEENVYVQSRTGIVSAFSSETGQLLWSRLIGQPGMQAFPASSNEEQLLLSIGLRVYAISKRSGDTLWELALPSHPSTSPELDDRKAYIGMADGSVYTYDLPRIRLLYQKGMLPEWSHNALLWRFKAEDGIVSPPISSGPVVSFASRNGYAYGVTSKDNRLKYQFRSEGRIATPLGRGQEWIFIADSKWRLYCLQQQTGRIRWSTTCEAPIAYQPRVVGQQVYVTPHRNGLSARSLTSGLNQWQQRDADLFVAASDERVYAANPGGSMLVLDRQTGTVIGRMGLESFSLKVSNDRTDRIIIANPQGLVLTLRERGSDFPVYHLYPERRPILPEFGPDASEAD